MTMLNSNFNFETSKPPTITRPLATRPKYPNRPPKNKKKLFFIFLKLFNCLVISLAYFGFSSSYLIEIMDVVKSKKYHVYTYYQSRLYIMEFLCWIIPLVIYFLWSKSQLQRVNLNKVLTLCAIYSFLISLTALNSDAFFVLILFRLFYCCMLSMAFWINLIDLLSASKSKHLIPLGAYFLIATLSNLMSSFSINLGVKPYHLIIGILFFISVISSKLVKIEFFGKLNKNIDDDFSIIDVGFKGIRTSVAFLEIFSMSSIANFNMSTFLGAVNLTKYQGSNITKLGIKVEPQYFLLFEDEDRSTIVINNYYCNFCLLGLVAGFFLVSMFALIQVKKRCLSTVSKLVFVIYVMLEIFNFQGVKSSYLFIPLYTFLGINLCVKINDVIKGFKYYMVLSEMPMTYNFLYVKSFCFVIIACLAGFVSGLFTQIIILSVGFNLTTAAKAFGQSIYVFLMMILLTISEEDDNFLIQTVVENEANNTQLHTVITETSPTNNDQSTQSDQQNKSQSNSYQNSKLRSTYGNNNDLTSTYNNDSYNKYNNQTNFFSINENLLGGGDCGNMEPSAPIASSVFDRGDSSNLPGSKFGNSSYNRGAGCGSSNDYNDRNREDNSNQRSNRRGRRRDLGSNDTGYNNDSNYNNGSNYNNDYSTNGFNSNYDNDNSSFANNTTSEPINNPLYDANGQISTYSNSQDTTTNQTSATGDDWT